MPTLENLLYLLPILLVGLPAHELAHAFVANALGDPTAKRAGRVTLNPLRHLDVIGTLVLVVSQAFGWAKPVPINPANFSNPRRDSLLVSAAGPVSNLLLAVAGSILLHSSLLAGSSDIVFRLMQVFIYVNIILFVFNMLPFPPLDGSHVLEALLPPGSLGFFRLIEPYGVLILFGVIIAFPGALSFVMSPLVGPISTLLL